MPRIRSAKKALRQSVRRRARNLAKKRLVKDAEKKFRRALAGKNATEVREALRMFSTAVDKAAKTGVIANNAARRMKSRMARKIPRS